jgi:CRP-like cAMP-binding protein
LEGTLRVVIPTVRSDQPTVVRLLTPGDVIGEVAFFTDGLRCASVQTVEKSKLLVLDTRALQRLRKSEPELAAMFFYNMSQILAYRLRDTARF